MKFELSINFAYNICDCITNTGESDFFNKIDDLKLAIKNGRDYFKMPYKLSVTRTVQITEPDLPNKNEHNIICVPYIQLSPHILKREGFDFIVSNKLIFPNDVREALTKKYGSTLNFDTNKQLDEKQPVFLGGVIGKRRYGMRDSRTGAQTQMRKVVYYPLTDKHVVIDENLNQIYPEKTGKMPSVLTELLSKKVIEIIQR